MAQICFVNVHIPHEMSGSALLKRACVNECCGCEVGMLWLSPAFSPHPASACPWGAVACFFSSARWWKEQGGEGARRGTGRGRLGGVHTYSSLPLHYLWLTYFGSEQQRPGRGTGQNHRLTVVPRWVEQGVWLPNGVALPSTITPRVHTLTQNKQRTKYQPTLLPTVFSS